MQCRRQGQCNTLRTRLSHRSRQRSRGLPGHQAHKEGGDTMAASPRPAHRARRWFFNHLPWAGTLSAGAVPCACAAGGCSPQMTRQSHLARQPPTARLTNGTGPRSGRRRDPSPGRSRPAPMAPAGGAPVTPSREILFHRSDCRVPTGQIAPRSITLMRHKSRGPGRPVAMPHPPAAGAHLMRLVSKM